MLADAVDDSGVARGTGMGSSRQYAPLAYNSLVALAGAAAMFALVRSLADAPPGVSQRSASGIELPLPASRPDRLAFVAPGTFALLEPGAGVPLTTSSITPEADSTSAWSTETQPETSAPVTPAPRYTLLPSLRMPWQTPRPGAPKRLHTLKTRLAEIAPSATQRLAARFEAAKVAWPPAEIALLAIKDRKGLELHARTGGGGWSLIHRYRVLAASGGAGPKLRQGDRQVPEGVYAIQFLNPNSAYHVSLRVNYPNAFDRQMAARDGRNELGGDIMIHGKNLSAGCLAMGDEAVEELFVLAAQTGLQNVKLVIAPTDFREQAPPPAVAGQPVWLPQLYAEIATAMAPFKPPPSPGLLSFFTR